MFRSHITHRPWKYLLQKRQTAEIQDFLEVKPLYEQERNNAIEMQHETEIWKFSYESAVKKDSLRNLVLLLRFSVSWYFVPLSSCQRFVTNIQDCPLAL